MTALTANLVACAVGYRGSALSQFVVRRYVMFSRITTTGRIWLASAITAVVVPVVIWANLGSDSTGRPPSGPAPTVSGTTSTTSAPPLPVLYEVAPDWQVRGHSRFSDTESAKRSKNLTDNLVIGSDNVPPPLVRGAAQRDEDATSTTQRTITLAELGVFPVATDPNYLTTTTSKPRVTFNKTKSSTRTTKKA